MNDSTLTIDDMILTILIPAFDRPDLLRRAIESIINQSYRPLNIVISFDKSENKMDEVKEFCELNKSDKLNFEFYFQEKNLGPYQNAHFLWSKFSGRYFMWHAHDDYFIENDFLSQAMSTFRVHKSCTLIIGNSIIEPTTSSFSNLMMNIFSLEPRWEIFEGDYFYQNRLFADLHPSYSAVVIDGFSLKQLNYSDSWVSIEKYKYLNVEPDEGFTSLIMASSGNKVAVSSEVVSVRGNPEDSWSKTEFWQKNCFYGLLLQYAQLYKISKKLNQDKIAATALKLCGTSIIISPPSFALAHQVLKFGLPLRFFWTMWLFGTYKRKAQTLQSLIRRLVRRLII